MFRLSIYRTVLIVGCGLVAACAERPAAVAPVAPPAATKPIFVAVERGQSLDRIAQAYHVAKHDIITANHLKPPYRLKPGTVLTIPIVATEIAEPAITSSEADTPPHSAAKSDNQLRAAAKPDHEASAPTPVRRKKPKAIEQAVIPLDDPTPEQSNIKKSSSFHQEVIPLDDPAPERYTTGNSSTSSARASSHAAGPRISFPGPAPETDERPPSP